MRLAAAGLVFLIGTLSLAAPATAEFFTCNQRPGQVLYSYHGSPGQYGGHGYVRRSSNDFTARSSQSHQTHATYFGARHYWNDRTRW